MYRRNLRSSTAKPQAAQPTSGPSLSHGPPISTTASTSKPTAAPSRVVSSSNAFQRASRGMKRKSTFGDVDLSDLTLTANMRSFSTTFSFMNTANESSIANNSETNMPATIQNMTNTEDELGDFEAGQDMDKILNELKANNKKQRRHNLSEEDKSDLIAAVKGSISYNQRKPSTSLCDEFSELLKDDFEMDDKSFCEALNNQAIQAKSHLAGFMTAFEFQAGVLSGSFRFTDEQMNRAHDIFKDLETLLLKDVFSFLSLDPEQWPLAPCNRL